ncbi:MAG: hypothetical protein KF858_04610 [Candidatus Sumerlaeia bacterium]|nr:hypothetical protein [Candidatus Sumerlaeia bacterium]
MQRLAIIIGQATGGRGDALAEVLCRAGLPAARPRWGTPGGLVYAPSPADGAVALPDKGLFERRDRWRAEAREVLAHVAAARTRAELAGRLFRCEGETWHCPFDLPAVVHGLLNRWEEDLDPVRDSHGRWPLRASLLADGDLVDRPAADWLAGALGIALREALGLRGPAATPWGSKDWAFALTFDIDAAAMYRDGAWARTLRRLQVQRGVTATLPYAVEAALVLAGRRRDPLDNLDALADRLGDLDARATFFVQALRESPFDNYDLARAPLLVRGLRRLHARGHEIALHGSYATIDRDARFLARQRRALLRQTGVRTELHRAHYLRSGGPQDHALYARAGVRVDCTPGFSEREGFRLGTAWPTRTRTRAGDVTLVPMHVMDVTLRTHRQLDVTEAERAARRILARARETGGIGVVLWHPHNLEPRLWRHWREIPFALTEWAIAQGACVGTIGELVERWERFRRRWTPTASDG